MSNYTISLEEEIEKTDLQNVEFVFADWGKGKELLSKPDDYVNNLTEYDLSIRLKSTDPVTKKEYLDYASSQVLNWTVEEQKLMKAVVKEIKLLGKDYKLMFPKTIYFIQTTGQEESGAVYCRGLNAIIIPKNKILPEFNSMEDYMYEIVNENRKQFLDEQLLRFCLSNLFDLYLVNNPKIKEKLCNSIGYYKTGSLKLPTEAEKRRISIPGFENKYYFKGIVGDEELNLMPLFFSNLKYDERIGGNLGDYLKFAFVRVNIGEECTPIMRNGKIRIVNREYVENYMATIGYNTEYIDYPEDILAENFVLLLQKISWVQSPSIISKMKEILESGE